MSAPAGSLADAVPDCTSERVAAMAGVLAAAVMTDALSLTDGPACFRLMHERDLMALGFDEMDDLFEAKRVAARMIEDRARRATAFREPR